ncbi:MAG: hypothetical protein ACRELY_03705 [Polyangiaceae bacterium]
MRASISVFALVLAGLPACDGCARPSTRTEALADASAPLAVVDAASALAIADATSPLALPNGCTSLDPFVYLIGAPPQEHAAIALYRFAPATGETTRMAVLACEPFSIAVDRAGVFWASGYDGRLFTIDSSTGACHATAFAKGQRGFDTFHLAFASVPGSASETLFASDEHDSHGDPAPSKGLASIDRSALRLVPIGKYEAKTSFEDAPCSLAGTGDGRLFAQCPGQELWLASQHPDPTKISLARVADTTDWLPRFSIRPFAFFGGALWFFPHPCDTGNCEEGSHVTRFDLATKFVRADVTVLPLIVSAATTSTCAPL